MYKLVEFQNKISVCVCVCVCVLSSTNRNYAKEDNKTHWSEKSNRGIKLWILMAEVAKKVTLCLFFHFFQSTELGTMFHFLVLFHLQHETVISLYRWLCCWFWQRHRWFFFVTLTHSLPCCWKNVPTCGPEHLHMWSEYLNGKCISRVFKEKVLRRIEKVYVEDDL